MRVPAIVSLMALLFLTGCVRTTDPRQGGLFSYSPSAYEARQQEREARLSQIEAEQMNELATQQALQTQQTAVSAQVNQQRQQLAAMQNESRALAVSLNNIKTTNQEQQNRLAQLRSRQTAVDNQLSSLNQTQDLATKQALFEQLRRELRLLEQEAAILAGL